jgi:hypothetical protein
MGDEPKSDALTKQQNQEFGRGLLEEGQKRYDTQRREVVFEMVRRLMEFRDDALRMEQKYALAAEWYRAKLRALDDGAFVMDPVTGLLAFEDPDLNRPNY